MKKTLKKLPGNGGSDKEGQAKKLNGSNTSASQLNKNNDIQDKQ